MIFVEDSIPESSGKERVVMHRVARDILVACAAELDRQVAGITELDEALGKAVMLMRKAASADDDGYVLSSRLISDLQKADHLRQELQGLSRVVRRLSELDSLAVLVEADEVRVCTPVIALQERLLSGHASEDVTAPRTPSICQGGSVKITAG